MLFVCLFACWPGLFCWLLGWFVGADDDAMFFVDAAAALLVFAVFVIAAAAVDVV